MKRIKTKLNSVGIVLLMLFIPLATAAIEVRTDDLTIPVDYQNLQDDEEELDISRAIILTNTGAAAENITLSLVGLPSNYRLSLSTTTFQLGAGGTQTITLSGKIPVNTDQGIKEIGDLKVSATTDTLFRLKTEVKSMLTLNKIYVYVNKVQEKVIDENDQNEEVRNLEPGDEVQLRFRLENRFDEDYDNGDLDGTVGIQLDDSDFDQEIDLDEDFQLEAGDKIDSSESEIVLEFKVPSRAEDGDYNLDITIEAEDDNNANYELSTDLKLEVERQEEDVRLESLSVTPTEVSCNRRAELLAKVSNFGSDRQRHAALSLVNTQLGINLKEEFELSSGTSEDSSHIKRVSLDLGKDLALGTYPIVATAFIEFTEFADQKTVELVVKKCTPQVSTPLPVEETLQAQETEQPITTTAIAPTTTVAATAATIPTPLTGQVVKTVERMPYTVEDFLVAGIIIALVAVLALIIIFFLILIK